MLESLINLVKENAGDAIINNQAIPNERNDEAVQEAGHSIFDTLKGALSGGNTREVVDMFANGRADNSNPLVQQASGNLVGRLTEMFGLNADQATGLAGSLIPNVMNQFANRTADPNDNGFNAQDIFNQLSGGKTSGLNIQSILNKFKGGLDRDGDGDVDLQDLQGLLGGAGGAGGLMDKVKGMFQ